MASKMAKIEHENLEAVGQGETVLIPVAQPRRPSRYQNNHSGRLPVVMVEEGSSDVRAALEKTLGRLGMSMCRELNTWFWEIQAIKYGSTFC